MVEGKEKFVFFEGPPTPTVNPGIHHLEARAFKDIILDIKLCGILRASERRLGYTGLPVELQSREKLGLNSKNYRRIRV